MILQLSLQFLLTNLFGSVLIISANFSGPCVDSTYINCTDSHVCSDKTLKTYCPVTCRLCVPTTSPPCKDSAFIKCRDSHVCSDNNLRSYCPMTCGLCASTTHVPCVDSTFITCKDSHVCSDLFLKKFCPVTCGSCGKTTGCYYKGIYHVQGDLWDDGCNYRCTCQDGVTGRYVCTQKCFTWNLPDVCTLDPPAPGKCCKTPNCPSNIHISYPAGYTVQ